MKPTAMSMKHAATFAWVALGITALAPSNAATAQTLASSDFTTGSDGWTNGDFDTFGATTPVIYNAGNGTISVTDNYFYNGFVAPAAYLGDKSAAFGGTISFQLSEATTDGVPYAPLALFGGGLTLYANRTTPPGTSLTNYTIGLTGGQFYVAGDPYSGVAPTATDAQLLTVLSNLQRLTIQADWQGGPDFATLDNVVLAGPGVAGGVPEPATWAMMILGFGAIGGAIRRRPRTTFRFA